MLKLSDGLKVFICACVSRGDDSIFCMYTETVNHKQNTKVQDDKQVSESINNFIFIYLADGALVPQQTTASSIGPDELPPPYTSNEDRGLPMVTCRVCSAMIDISWKREQHVVKCNQCNEATVRKSDPSFSSIHINAFRSFTPHSPPKTADQKCTAWKEVRSMSL